VYWEKKICFRLTTRRIVIAILVATIVANMVIVGVVFGSSSFTYVSTQTPSSTAQPSITSSVVPPATIPWKTVTDTPTSLPTVTVTTTDTPTEHVTVEMCILNSSWPVYFTQQGDTLVSVARSIGSSVDELMLANCMHDARIQPGQPLYLPRLPVMTPTPTSSVTATYIPSITPTNTPTVTATITPNVSTVFQNPRGTYSCSERSDNFYVSVTPYDPQGVRSVIAIYLINSEPREEILMQPDGETYYGSTFSAGEYATVDIVNFYFIALDNSGEMTESKVYNASITPCPTIQQSN